jgi:hypothetical protein
VTAPAKNRPRVARANTMGGARPRNEADAYFTPEALAIAIAARVQEAFGSFSLVIEPSAGKGAFVRAARVLWPRSAIIAIEPHGGRHIDSVQPYESWHDTTWEDYNGFDSLPTTPGRRVLVLGNPPYNLPGEGRGDRPTTAERHVLLALDRVRDGDVLAFVLRAGFRSGKGRQERLFSSFPLRASWPVTPRPSFTRVGTDGSEYRVFVWVKGYSGPVDDTALLWTPERVVLTPEERAEHKARRLAQAARRVAKALAGASIRQLRAELRKRGAA